MEDINEAINKIKVVGQNDTKYYIKDNKVMFTSTLNAGIKELRDSATYKIIENKNEKCLKCKYYLTCKTIINLFTNKIINTRLCNKNKKE